MGDDSGRGGRRVRRRRMWQSGVVTSGEEVAQGGGQGDGDAGIMAQTDGIACDICYLDKATTTWNLGWRRTAVAAAMFAQTPTVQAQGLETGGGISFASLVFFIVIVIAVAATWAIGYEAGRQSGAKEAAIIYFRCANKSKRTLGTQSQTTYKIGVNGGRFTPLCETAQGCTW